MKSIECRLSKHFSTYKTEQYTKKSNLIHRKTKFQYASYAILIWSLMNIILLICIHTPMEHQNTLKSMIYHVQMCFFLIDPIVYIIIFRSLSIITLLRPIDEIHF